MNIKKLSSLIKKRKVIVALDYPTTEDPKGSQRDQWYNALKEWLKENVKPGMRIGVEIPKKSNSLDFQNLVFEEIARIIAEKRGQVIPLDSLRLRAYYYIQRQTDNSQKLAGESQKNQRARVISDKVNKLLRADHDWTEDEREHIIQVRRADYIAEQLRRHQPVIAIISHDLAVNVANRVQNYKTVWFAKQPIGRRILIRLEARRLSEANEKRRNAPKPRPILASNRNRIMHNKHR